MKAAPIKVLGGTREQRAAVRASLDLIPARLYARAQERLLTVRLDPKPARLGPEDLPCEGTVGTYYRDLALALVVPDATPWTVWHEVGHALDAALATTPGDRKWSTVDGIALFREAAFFENFPTAYARVNPAENFAERFAEMVSVDASRQGSLEACLRAADMAATLLPLLHTPSLPKENRDNAIL